MFLPAEVRDMRLTCLGVTIEEFTPSDFTYRGVGPLPFVTPMAPPISVVRPIGSGPRVSFAEPRASMLCMGSLGFRPEGSMGASSGHPASRVPPRPIPSTPSHTPLITSGFRPGESMTPTRHKTRPSHFQKWVKKFSGSGDPYDRQVVRAEEVSDLHVLKEVLG